MKKLKLAFDANGVVIDWVGGVQGYARWRTGIQLPPECCSRSTIVNREFVLPNGRRRVITEGEYKGWLDTLHQTREYFQWMRPVPHATEVLRRLAHAGHDLSIVSSIRSVPEEFLREWFWRQDIPAKLYAIRGGPKTDVYATHDIAVDDELDNLRPLTWVGGSTLPIFMPSVRTRHESARISVGGPILKIEKWWELQRIVEQYLEERVAA